VKIPIVLSSQSLHDDWKWIISNWMMRHWINVRAITKSGVRTDKSKRDSRQVQTSELNEGNDLSIIETTSFIFPNERYSYVRNRRNGAGNHIPADHGQ
jgi:hypothetical protein